MRRSFLRAVAFLAGISVTFAKPQEPFAGADVNYVPSSHSTGSDTDRPQDRHGAAVNLLDASKWKEMLAEGQVREMVDTIQRALGARRAFRARTQWGGVEHPNLGNAVRNTVSWNAFHGDKGRLDVIMDSKFKKDKGKVHVIEPSLGLSFQMKY